MTHFRPAASGPPDGEGREALLAQRFVMLADTLVDDFDVVDVMALLVETCVEFLQVEAAALLLRDQRGGIVPVAASSEQAELLELLQLQNDEGPCLDCVATGSAVDVADLAAAASRWPRFVPAAVAAGFGAVYAVPLRLRLDVVGGLNLFCADVRVLTPRDRQLGQAFADMASIGILQQRSVHRQTLLAEQLQSALNSRVIIEQAKGVIAEYSGLDMDAAYRALRDYSRGRGAKLSDVAGALVRRRLPVSELVGMRDDAAREAQTP